MVKSYTSKYDVEVHMSKGFSFSSATTPMLVQVNAFSLLKKLSREIRGWFHFYRTIPRIGRFFTSVKNMQKVDVDL